MSLPTPYYDEDGITIFHGDCREVMAELAAGSIRMIWTDPPYGHGNHCGDLNDQLNKHRGIESQPIANDTVDEAAQAAWLAACKWMQTASLPHTAGEQNRPTMGHHNSEGE